MRLTSLRSRWAVLGFGGLMLGIAPAAGAAVGTFPLNAKLIYNPSTGNVSINPNGFSVNAFNLQDVVFDATNVFAGPQAPTFPPGGFSTVDTDTRVGWATLTTTFNTPQNLGNVAVAGLTSADLVAQLSGLPGANDETFYTATGVIGRQSFDLVVVPEPGSSGLIAAGAAGVLVRRRRRGVSGLS